MFSKQARNKDYDYWESKKEVINNIKVNIKNNELNKKVEVNDPCISDEELEHLIIKFYKNQDKPIYKIKNKIAKSDSINMTNIDYESKKKEYENAYNKKLIYKFDIKDIAGWKDI